MAGGEAGGQQSVSEGQVAAVDRNDGGVGEVPSPSMIWTRSPMWAWAALARWRPSAIVLPCRAFRDPAVTPTSRPPPCPPARIWAGRVSSESPRLGPSVVEVSATAERTPGVARASLSAAVGSPGPAVVRASWPVSPACLCWVMACSMVVVLNRSVQLMATVSTSGVLAEEKRRAAVRRLAEARKPPTGESAPSAGPSSRAITYTKIGPRKPTATTRRIAVISAVAAAVSGVLAVTATRTGARRRRARAPPMIRPGPSSRGSTEASVSARVGGTLAALLPAARTASSEVATAQPITAAAGSQS